MATTDARPGFKLPWSSDRHESDSNPTTEAGEPATSEADQHASSDVQPGDVETTVQQAVDSSPIATQDEPFDPWRIGTPKPVEAAPKRKPNKLMADLTRAMQSAAESARNETLERLQADAKAFIENIHARSGTEADELRRSADADIAGIREWSKAEIARIREETDSRIAARKGTLETEIEQHAALIEQRIERVQAHVSWFEAEMAGFFERLLAEDDPTRLAAMAENLPEPPTFEDDDLPDLPERQAPVAVAEPEVAEAEVVEPEAPAEDDVPAEDGATSEAVVEAVEPAEDPETAFAAIEAAAQAAEDVAAPTEDVDPVPEEAEAIEQDPRLAAIGLSPEDAAEAEAEATQEGEDDIATFSDDALAARLAGLVPNDGADAVHVDLLTTRVLVTGLVSVASIASFKRQLGRLEGVSSVGVSSGPDGEFIFAVNHGPEVRLGDAIPTLPGFAAHVTDTTDETVTVAARDPETES